MVSLDAHHIVIPQRARKWLETILPASPCYCKLGIWQAQGISAFLYTLCLSFSLHLEFLSICVVVLSGILEHGIAQNWHVSTNGDTSGTNLWKELSSLP